MRVGDRRAAGPWPVRRPALHADEHGPVLSPRAARAGRSLGDRRRPSAVASGCRSSRRPRRADAALRLARPLRAAPHATRGTGGAAAERARRPRDGLRRLEPPRRPRGGHPFRSRVLGAQHDGDRAGRGLVRGARRARDRPRARARRGSRAAGLWKLHAVPRRVPDRRARRARRARRPRLPLDRPHSGPIRFPTPTRMRSAIACTGATSARTSARGTPAPRCGAPASSPTRRRGSRCASGSSCPTTSCSRATGTSTSPRAIPATCVATR